VDIQAWLKCPLEGQYPYLIVDAECEEVRENHKVVRKSAIIIEGIRKTGRREISGVYVANSETETSWSEAFVDLKRRSLEGLNWWFPMPRRGGACKMPSGVIFKVVSNNAARATTFGMY